jgi:hypothetical protein
LKIYLRGARLDNAATKFKLTTGGSSSCDSHPTGGDAGGDIKNVR